MLRAHPQLVAVMLLVAPATVVGSASTTALPPAIPHAGRRRATAGRREHRTASAPRSASVPRVAAQAIVDAVHQGVPQRRPRRCEHRPRRRLRRARRPLAAQAVRRAPARPRRARRARSRGPLAHGAVGAAASRRRDRELACDARLGARAPPARRARRGDPERLGPAPRRRPTGLPAGDGPVRTVGMLARIDPWKGQHVLLEAFARGVRADATCACSSPARRCSATRTTSTSCSSRAAELGVADQVDFLGHVNDVDALIARWDLAVQASTRPEPLGQNVLQYLAAGRAVDRGRRGRARRVDHRRRQRAARAAARRRHARRSTEPPRHGCRAALAARGGGGRDARDSSTTRPSPTPTRRSTRRSCVRGATSDRRPLPSSRHPTPSGTPSPRRASRRRAGCGCGRGRLWRPAGRPDR